LVYITTKHQKRDPLKWIDFLFKDDIPIIPQKSELWVIEFSDKLIKHFILLVIILVYSVVSHNVLPFLQVLITHLEEVIFDKEFHNLPLVLFYDLFVSCRWRPIHKSCKEVSKDLKLHIVYDFTIFRVAGCGVFTHRLASADYV
jgi:hypothetical protein